MNLELSVRVDVSVIIPMYNVENLVTETLESVTYNSCNFEVLIINDGSTDTSLAKAEEFAIQDSRFKLISQENQGVSVARNLGLSLAKGDYICFLDADDLLTENALDKMLNAAQKNEADFVYGAVKKFNSQKKWYLRGHLKNNVFKPGPKNIYTNPELAYFVGVGAKLIHRSILKNKKFPINMKYSEDSVVIYQCYLHAKKIFCIQEDIYLYRERDLVLNEASASQLMNNNAFIYLQDCFLTVGLSRQAINENTIFNNDEKKIIKRKYYDRFFAYEIWPFFIKILKHDKKNINNAIYLFLDFLKKHSVQELNEVAAFRFYLIKVFIDNLYLLSVRNFYAYRCLLSYLFGSLSKDIKVLCQKKSVYGAKWNDSYKIACGRLDKAFIHFLSVKIRKSLFNRIKTDPKLIRNIYFPIVSMLPINKNKVVFATTKSKPMSENAKSIYDGIVDKDYEVYKYFNQSGNVKSILKRYYHCATAKYVFLEDYYKPFYGLHFRQETKVVQLWHACGAFKRFGISASNKSDSNNANFEVSAHGGYTHVITSSEEMNPLYAEAFQCDVSKVFNTGIPRTDKFFNKEKLNNIAKKVLQEFPNLKNTINVLYAPTFRGGPSERSYFQFNIDWNELMDSLPENYRILVKLHPQVKIVHPPIPEHLVDRVILLPSKVNVGDLMVFCDALITDYSSLIFEYSLLNKPIVYYPYDFLDYIDERGFYFPYEDYVYGPIAYNTEELKNAINQCFKISEDFQLKREEFRNKFLSNCDGNSSTRLINLIFNETSV